MKKLYPAILIIIVTVFTPACHSNYTLTLDMSGESQTALSSAVTSGIDIKISKESKLREKFYIKYTATAGVLCQRQDDNRLPNLFPDGGLELKTVSDDAQNGAAEWTGAGLTPDVNAAESTVTVDVYVYSDSSYADEITSAQAKIKGDTLTFKPE